MNEEQRYVRKQAVALKYDPSVSSGPIVAAKGKGKIAEEILLKATEANVPIYEDKGLVEILGQLDMNTAIPEELYQAVAEVFAFIYRLDQQHNLIRPK
ncbi:EscU/YscU/HrcU family type III secretion system export apparatus switch protein [Caryophanon latum]|uniref:Type III secretion system protein n=1 Tax=Caryophanon latum TaxID=33977 RepID=A0A1C0YWD6_9BACL|nr:EscU/YscU/HrcU family type III secretion system export apparatus switch protein [Caryophanon latum]OCS91486.1 type III secretion system protein [Caryophanon latum]